ncbi:MAG: CAP-associated domain-containing protein, partial [Bacillota bacterium]
MKNISLFIPSRKIFIGVMFLALLVLSWPILPAGAEGITPAVIAELNVGMSRTELIDQVGEPTYVAPTPYGYSWYIYNQDYENYFQIGVAEEKVVNIYSNSLNWRFKEAEVGQLFMFLQDQLPLKEQISLDYENATLQIEVPDLDRGSVYMHYHEEEDVIAHYFVDLHDDEIITAILISEIETTLATGNFNYEISWRGKKPNFEPDPISEDEQAEVDEALGYQFRDLTNAIRVRHGLEPLSWHMPAADMAAAHSQDMYENEFFSHTSPSTGEPGERAEARNISYSLLLENLSYGQNNAIFAHEG